MALSDNIWWTRKARIQTEKRLLANAFQTRLLLLWYSFFSVTVAIYYLKFNTESEYSNIAWVVFSVLILSISGFINGLSFKERSALIKDSYEALNVLYHKSKKQNNDERINRLTKEYENILSVCENHTDIDYYTALCHTYLSQKNASKQLDRQPTIYIWLLVVFSRLKRFMLLSGLYILPIIIFILVEFPNVSKTAI